MKQIPLTQGKVAIVDDCDYDFLTQWTWCVSIRPDGRPYAVRASRGSKGKHHVLMHREVAHRAGLLGQYVDHRNNTRPLDNRRANLRPATKSQNGANRGPTRLNTSGYKGVFWHKRGRKWQAQIIVNQTAIHLGLFVDKIAAARAYNQAAIEYFGTFAYQNPV